MRQLKQFEAYLDDFNTIVIYLSKQSYDGVSRIFYLQNAKGELEELTIQTVELTSKNYNKYTCKCEKEVEIGKSYHVYHEFARRCVLQLGYVVKQPLFDEKYAYNGNDLGAHYTKEETTFKLWAPTAVQVNLNIDAQSYPMERKEKGVYEITIHQDLEKKSYQYFLLIDGEWKASEDPYGKSSLANSSYSVVINENRFKDEKIQLPTLNSYTDAIIYEMNVRDFTAQNTKNDFKHAKQFLGVVEENENTIKRNIGFTYLKDLGITHVQLMPVLDFASVDENYPSVFYNWGYDPAQFMTFEGSFCSNPDDPYARIIEFKEMVKKLHEAGIRVILDVVFNHVFELDHMCLQKVVPNYFFQMNKKGHYSNGSWCGNDYDSTTYMGRKYILDCCKCLVDMYHVDGFRFDLMGILDIDTMNEVYQECSKIEPSIMIYGEGWNMPSYLQTEQRATIINNHKMPHIAHFSDRFRDIVKGKTSIEEVYQKGYCSGDASYIHLMKDVMSASVCNEFNYSYFVEPTNSINYVECHDNQTCWDKLKECCKEDQRENRMMRQKMCIAAVLFAQGIPFLHSGQEFARTKYGKPNTYNAKDDINWLNWDRKETYKSIVEYTKDCIAFRKEHACLRYSTTKEIKEHVSFDEIENTCLLYHIKDELEELSIIFNPTTNEYQYKVDVKQEVIFYNGKTKGEIVEHSIQIQPLSVLVLKK